MFFKSLLGLALVYIGTVSSECNFNLVLNSTAANNTMKALNSLNDIDKYTQLIIQQVAFPSLVGWDSLIAEQEKVKETARKWRTDERPALFKINNGFIAFNNQFAAFVSYLLDYVPRLGNQEARSEFVALIQELQSQVLIRKDEADSTVNELKAYLRSTEAHKSLIDGAYEVIFLENLGENGKLQELTDQIAALETEVSRINAPVTATMKPAENLAHARASRANFTRVTTEKAKLRQQFAELEFAVNQTIKLHRRINILVTDVNRTVNEVSPVAEAWSQLHVNYGLVINTLQMPPNTRHQPELQRCIRETLTTTQQEWSRVTERANSIKMGQLKSHGINS